MDAKQIEQMPLFSGLGKRERAHFFGEIGVLDEERVRKATVTATSPMKLVVMSGHELRGLSRDMPEVIEKLRSACYDRVSGGAS